MNKYHIRFNTKHGDSNLVWRIFENGREYLAEEVEISGKVYTETTLENGEIKWNIACYGDLMWVGKKAVIISRDFLEKRSK